MLLVLLVSSACYANEFSIGYAPICRHLNEDNPNESNNGVFLSYNKWMGGTFVNSYGDRSYFVGRSFRIKDWKSINDDIFIRGNLHLGVLNGYGDEYPNLGGWTIGIAPTVEVGYKIFSIETMVTPFDGGIVSPMFKLTWRY